MSMIVLFYNSLVFQSECKTKKCFWIGKTFLKKIFFFFFTNPFLCKADRKDNTLFIYHPNLFFKNIFESFFISFSLLSMNVYCCNADAKVVPFQSIPNFIHPFLWSFLAFAANWLLILSLHKKVFLKFFQSFFSPGEKLAK